MESTPSWHALPNEMKLAIIDTLELDDVKTFAKVDQRTYQACVPAQFKVCLHHLLTIHIQILMG